MPYKILHKDISKIKADIIVNLANAKPVCTPGMEMDIYRSAGADQMLKARKGLGIMQCGQVAYTDAFGLNAKQVIHVVAPVWKGGRDNEYDTLRKCYRSVFCLADELKGRSIAIPLLMSGVFRFPPQKALNIALDEIHRFLQKHDMTIYLIVISMDEVELPETLVARIDEFLGITSVGKKQVDSKDIKSVAEENAESFGSCLFRMIDERHCSDAEIYKRANIDRRLISRLRQNPEKHISKNTAFALAIGLKLTYEETKEFIALAGWAFSPSYKFDRIVRFFIENGQYDIMAINEALFIYTGKTLGGC